MVIYRGSDGKPGYHQTDDIHDAVGFVESMRNEQGVEHARIFRLEEVVFQYRPYYRVELADSLSDGGEDEAAASPTNGALGANGTNGLNGGGESYEPAQGDPVDALGPPDPPADSGADLAASTTGLGSDGSSESTDEGTGSGAKRGLFGR
jgi:hypothetical protein